METPNDLKVLEKETPVKILLKVGDHMDQKPQRQDASASCRELRI